MNFDSKTARRRVECVRAVRCCRNVDSASHHHPPTPQRMAGLIGICRPKAAAGQEEIDSPRYRTYMKKCTVRCIQRYTGTISSRYEGRNRWSDHIDADLIAINCGCVWRAVLDQRARRTFVSHKVGQARTERIFSISKEIRQQFRQMPPQTTALHPDPACSCLAHRGRSGEFPGSGRPQHP